MICFNCGTEVNNNEDVCPKCGEALKEILKNSKNLAGYCKSAYVKHEEYEEYEEYDDGYYFYDDDYDLCDEDYYDFDDREDEYERLDREWEEKKELDELEREMDLILEKEAERKFNEEMGFYDKNVPKKSNKELMNEEYQTDRNEILNLEKEIEMANSEISKMKLKNKFYSMKIQKEKEEVKNKNIINNAEDITKEYFEIEDKYTLMIMENEYKIEDLEKKIEELKQLVTRLSREYRLEIKNSTWII